jgi:predicted amidophosphoribosyltransferase
MYDLITPEPGPGVCPACFNFTLESAGRCRACRASETHLSALVPVSYAQAGGGLHRALADYKRAAEPAVPYLSEEIARLLSRFLARHERCVAMAAGVPGFDCVVVVPSSDRRRDVHHPLRRIVRERVSETLARYCDALGAGPAGCTPHAFDPRRFVARMAMDRQRVLLIDDVWTTGASAQSAAAVLREAGAETVAAVVIGRYVNGFWGAIADRLAEMEHRFEPDACAICRGRARPAHVSTGPARGVVVGNPAGPLNQTGTHSWVPT